MSTYDPTSKYATTATIDTTKLVISDGWKCELVPAKDKALSSRANLDPFGSDINWVEREREMIKLMHDQLGIGLAAPQVGSSYNMFVMHHRYLGDIGVYKPEILEYSDEEVFWEEGCLSFPMIILKIKRAEKVRVRYYKNDGETVVETWMDGIDARCFQHEYDHLYGRLFIDKVSDLKLKMAAKRRDKLLKLAEKTYGKQ